MRSVEPEREMVRRALPFGAVALILALAVGTAFGGLDAGISAAIGVAISFGNFALNAYVISWAASRNVTLLPAVALVGFFVRMVLIMGLAIALDTQAFFSPIAFICGLLPLAVLLLGVEVKMVMGPMGREIRVPAGAGSHS